MSEFAQCPHEAIRATCPAPCGCRCEACLALAARLRYDELARDRPYEITLDEDERHD